MKKFPDFVEPERSLSRKKYRIWPIYRPNEFTPYLHTLIR